MNVIIYFLKYDKPKNLKWLPASSTLEYEDTFFGAAWRHAALHLNCKNMKQIAFVPSGGQLTF